MNLLIATSNFYCSRSAMIHFLGIHGLYLNPVNNTINFNKFFVRAAFESPKVKLRYRNEYCHDLTG